MVTTGPCKGTASTKQLQEECKKTLLVQAWRSRWQTKIHTHREISIVNNFMPFSYTSLA